MQASQENSAKLYSSRLLWRLLACTLLLAAGLAAAAYIIINTVETKAQHAFISSRQQMVSHGLSDYQELLAGGVAEASGSSEFLRSNLDALLAQAGLSYLIILDHRGEIIAGGSAGFPPGSLSLLLEEAKTAKVLPMQETVTLGGQRYENTVLNISDSAGLRAVYGISVSSSKLAGAEFVNMLVLLFTLGLVALLLTVLCVYFIFIKPLRHILGLAWDSEKLPAQAETARNDEFGALCRMLTKLHSPKELPEEKPQLSSSDLLLAMSAMLDDLEHGLVFLDLDGVVIASNHTIKQILRHDTLALGEPLLPLLTSIMNPEQIDEFQRRFALLPQSTDGGLEVVTEDSAGVHSYDLRLSLHKMLGEDCILCIFYNLTNERRLQQIKLAASAHLEKAIRERTEELVQVNEQLRQENSERREIEAALVRAESRYREIVNNSIEGIFQRSADGRLLSANASMARILGYPSVETLLEAYQKPGNQIAYTSEMAVTIVELLEIRGWVSNLEFQAAMQDGSPVWVAMNARRVADNSGETLYYEAFMEDITSRKKTEEKLVHQAFHDPLTGLPNRALFLDRLRMALRRAKRHDEYLFAVLYLDLDRFKNINDSFGHSAGDQVLNHATERILQCVRDLDTVARFGGDEFAVLLTDLEKPSQAVLIAKRISEALNEPMELQGQEISTGASIGIVLNNVNYETPDDILRDADTAMYRVKTQGRRGYTIFNDRMREETVAALAIEHDLRGAVERDEIEAFYQPLVEMQSGKVIGFEALMRWRRGSEMVSPVLFIPIAEESGAIYDLGLHMLKIVCAQVVEWSACTGNSNFVVHINVSAKQLMATQFWQDAQKIIVQSNVNPKQLIFEITESVFLDYGSQVISIMNMVRDFGIRFCLDDFGTGFSSLSYLRTLPLGSLKVDRSFIVDIGTDNYSEVILRNLITMGHDLGLHVISEGVDQVAQVDALHMVGCCYAQGFHFAEPLPPLEALEYTNLHGFVGRS